MSGAQWRYPQLRDPSWLTARYVVEGRPIAEIAGQLGCSPSRVKKALHSHGIPTRPQARYPRPGGARSRRRRLLAVETLHRKRRMTGSDHELAVKMRRVFEAPPPSTTNKELRMALIDLAASALRWAERLQPPTATSDLYKACGVADDHAALKESA